MINVNHGFIHTIDSGIILVMLHGDVKLQHSAMTSSDDVVH